MTGRASGRGASPSAVIAFVRDRLALQRMRLFTGAIPELPDALEAERIWRRLDPAATAEWVERQKGIGSEGKKMYATALREKHWLYLAEDGDRELGHRWIGFGLAYVPWPFACEFVLGHDLAYFYDVLVEVQHRRKGLGAASVLRGLRDVREAGLGRCASMVAHSNHASSVSWLRLGLQHRSALHVSLPRLRSFIPPDPWRGDGVGVRQPERT
jgi:ribosomal protein S18 acetylase RimI-like enzyme